MYKMHQKSDLQMMSASQLEGTNGWVYTNPRLGIGLSCGYKVYAPISLKETHCGLMSRLMGREDSISLHHSNERDLFSKFVDEFMQNKVRYKKVARILSCSVLKTRRSSKNLTDWLFHIELIWCSDWAYQKIGCETHAQFNAATQFTKQSLILTKICVGGDDLLSK